MDKRKRYFLIIDTETANSLDCPLVYDIGGAIIDKDGKIYKSFSFAIRDIMVGESDLMQSAYYAEKIPTYWQEIDDKSQPRKLVSFYYAKQYIKVLLEDYSTNLYPCTVVAHNARFDLTALNNTQRWLTKSQYRYFFPYGTEIWDTLTMARMIYGNSKSYKNYCKNRGYVTSKNSQPRFTAEILYRYLSGNEDFVELHTGIDDILIEKEIFKYCLRSHKKYRKTYWVA